MIGLVLLALLVGFTATVNLGVGLAAAVIPWGVYAFSRDLTQGRM